jgi:peroxiredoxin
MGFSGNTHPHLNPLPEGEEIDTGDFRLKKKLVAIIVTLFLLSTACNRGKGGETTGSIIIGSKAPEFSMTSLSGQQISLKDLRGQGVLVNFWATWCYPCREEMDDLKAAYEKYKDQGIVILGIDMKEGEETVRKFIESYKITYPILIDMDGKVGDAYNVFGIPSSFFIDKDGVIRDIILGEMNQDSINNKIEKLISMEKGK